MRNRKEVALEKFLGGYNCAQSIFFTFSGDVNVNPEAALKIACGLGTGMGRKQEVCGAVTGGILVIGAKHGRGENDDRGARDITYAKTRDLMDRFAAKHGAVLCRQLLDGCDMATEGGQKIFREKDLLNKKCRPCVESVVEILEEIL